MSTRDSQDGIVGCFMVVAVLMKELPVGVFIPATERTWPDMVEFQHILIFEE
jgi:hypothetical protein